MSTTSSIIVVATPSQHAIQQHCMNTTMQNMNRVANGWSFQPEASAYVVTFIISIFIIAHSSSSTCSTDATHAWD
jgi:hypothetical protein